MSDPSDSTDRQAASPNEPSDPAANNAQSDTDPSAASEPLTAEAVPVDAVPSEALFVAKVIAVPESPTVPESEPVPGESAEVADSGTDQATDEATPPAVTIKSAALAIGPVRVGSPFAPGTASGPQIKSSPAVVAVSLAELNALMYLAMGATAAAVMVLVFAIIGTFLFPVGGLMVAALGVVLAVLGIFSKQKRYQWTAASMLPLHLTAAGVCYFRALM